MMSSRVTVETWRFEAAHGKAPKGKGWWAFAVGEQTFWAEWGTFTEARRQAQTEARRVGVDRVVVLP